MVTVAGWGVDIQNIESQAVFGRHSGHLMRQEKQVLRLEIHGGGMGVVMICWNF